MKVLTFSRTFPAYHPKKGEPTFFVEKIWDGLSNIGNEYSHLFPVERLNFIRADNETIWAKHHTIRSGNRWKVGDFFSPRVWSGKPYASKQIQLAPPIEIKKIWHIQIEGFFIWINKQNFYNSNRLAQNDGLSELDFWNWFPHKAGKIFNGQIICWNDTIEY